MLRVTAKDFREGFFKLNEYLFKENAYDWVRGQVTAHKFHVEVIFKTADCDLEMSEVNYTPHKWKQLLRCYFNAEEYSIMIARLQAYQAKGGKYKKYIPDIGMNFKARSNASGACLMAFTVGYNTKYGWHAEVFTRASELTIRWFMDLIFIHVLIRGVGEEMGFEPSECTVFWHMVSTYQSITSMPLFLVMNGDEDMMKQYVDHVDAPEELSNWHWGTVRRYKKSFIGDGYQNFRVQRRPAEAYRMITGQMEPKKSVLTKDLNVPRVDVVLSEEEEDGDE